jgi:chemotaxis protein CheY-P-specific phosphatase CheC
MLPDNMLDEVVSAEKYDEDTEDSYGEIANIIAGSYTKVFEEMYPENCRFVRKNQEIILPAKVDVSSDEPVPDQLYYQVVTGMILNGRQLGDFVVLLPAAPFGLEEDKPVVVAEPAVVAKPEPTVTGKAAGSDKAEPAVVAPQVNATPDFDVKKHRKRVDALLELCRQKIGVEMGALLGVEVTLSDQECRLVSKEDYFMDEASGKQILAHMDVVGEVQGNGYLFVGLKDAIYIGGTLIMLPAGELEKVVIDEAFGDDTEDAYGEIANIVSGVYSTLFEEQYIKKIRFVKTGIEQVLPLKVDTDSDVPMPNQFYYMSSSTLNIGGKTMGKMQMLFPAVMLQLDGLLQQEAETPVPQPEEKKTAPSVERVESADSQPFDVLVVSDDALETEKIMDVLARRHMSAKVLSFKENVADYLPGEVKAVLLVMRDVNEKAFALAIKINAACSLPLIAAGPRWTRSKVITAVKYGVNDILLTPATSDDIGEKIEHLSVKLAA